ncbi:uncharacterized protein J3D65DRAFT_612451 [Phyllosticta citribraziliensis]|uniref:Uncharacterized protein n=1 Tax=Phyllosticta citribraziliensis TaxID=989973 RepID=A0ABR1M383_9PEZI
MRARCAFINALIPAGTVESLSLALDHTMDMLRLCRGDNLGMRWQVPALLLRLGKEQQCYDFIKWWAAIEDDGSYDWGNTSLPYLDVKNAGVFEPVDIFTKRFSVYLTFDMLLLKVKLLLDLIALQRSPERSDGFSTSIVQARKDEFRAAGLQPLIEKLESQISQLYQAVKSSNPHLWPAFMAPEPHLGTRPDFYTPGDLTEAQIALQQSYQAWNETPGAEDVIHRLMAQDPDFPSHD